MSPSYGSWPNNSWHSDFLSSLKEQKDNQLPEPYTTKHIEAQVDQNESSKNEFAAQMESIEKVVKLPNGFRTIWKDQSYSYATGTFKPAGLCTKENPGRNSIFMIQKLWPQAL